MNEERKDQRKGANEIKKSVTERKTQVEKELQRTGGKEIMFEKMDKEDKKVKIISNNCNKVEKIDIVKRMNEEIRLQREEIRQRDKGKNESIASENHLMFEQKDKRPKKRGFKKKVSAKLVHPRPERDMCRYEKLREDNIKKRRGNA